MSTITVELVKFKFSPWGLFREDVFRGVTQSVPIVWLTEDDPKATIELDSLTTGDVQRIRIAGQTGILRVNGLDIPAPVAPQVTINPRPAEDPRALRDEVLAVIAEEDRIAAEIEAQYHSSYPGVEELLSLNVAGIKKKLKELITQDVPLHFYTKCRELEEHGKARKTVLSLLLDIIEQKVASTGMDGSYNRVTGRSYLADAYHALIEETYEEDDNS